MFTRLIGHVVVARANPGCEHLEPRSWKYYGPLPKKKSLLVHARPMVQFEGKKGLVAVDCTHNTYVYILQMRGL